MTPLNQKRCLAELGEFLDYQLTDYGLEWAHTITDDSEENVLSVDVGIYRQEELLKTLSFELEVQKHKDNKVKISVEVYDGNYEEVSWFDCNVKYFWIAFLEWPGKENSR